MWQCEGSAETAAWTVPVASIRPEPTEVIVLPSVV